MEALTELVHQLGIKKASVGVFLHQSVNELLGFVEATRSGVFHLLPGFLSGRRIQVDLQVMKRRELVGALLYVRRFDCTQVWCEYLVGSVRLYVLLVDLPGFGHLLWRRRLLVVLASHPEVHVLLAELRLQEAGEDGASSW